MGQAQTNTEKTPYAVPQVARRADVLPLGVKSRVCSLVAVAICVPLAAWTSQKATEFGLRAERNDPVVTVMLGTMALGLVVVSVTAAALVVGILSLTGYQRSIATRLWTVAITVPLTLWGFFLIDRDAEQGTYLVAASIIYICTLAFERNPARQSPASPARWLVRAMAAGAAIPMLGIGGGFVFDGLNLLNKLHVGFFPVFSRMPATIPESNMMIFGMLSLGVPFSLIGGLLFYQVFNGVVFVGWPWSTKQRA